MRWGWAVAVVLGCAWTSGCSDETIEPEVPGGGGMSSVSTTVTVSSSSSTAGSGGATATSSSTGTSMIGAPCDPPCPDGKYCDQGFIFSACAADGVSMTAPGYCDEDSPACGCDGMIYRTACAAREAGVGTGAICEPPPGMFACGDIFCTSGSEVCSTDHVFFSAQCRDLPPECIGADPLDCSCFPPGTTCDGCSMDAEGNLFLDCDSHD